MRAWGSRVCSRASPGLESKFLKIRKIWYFFAEGLVVWGGVGAARVRFRAILVGGGGFVTFLTILSQFSFIFATLVLFCLLIGFSTSSNFISLLCLLLSPIKISMLYHFYHIETFYLESIVY